MLKGRYIGVIGQSSCDKELADIARCVGELIAEEGAYLVCGGLGGVMEYASEGAYSKGGVTIGILPESSRMSANPYIKFSIASGIGFARNFIIVNTSDILIAIGGAFGTLSEIAYALQLNKPVIGISTWEINHKTIKDKIIRVATPVEAIEKAKEMLK